MKGPIATPRPHALLLLHLCIFLVIATGFAFTTSPIQKNGLAAAGPSSYPNPINNIIIHISTPTSTKLHATISEKEANSAIDKVVQALRKDKSANEELGRLQKVNNILGYGSPRQGVLAVRFNASFQKGGMGRSAIPLPFGLGQSNKSEGRGTMVGQVKASVDAKSGKVLEASVFRDLGYGRSFNLKV